METKVKTKTNRTSVLRKVTVTAIMSAFSLVVMMIEFPIPIMPSFIKFDISELPALITSFAFGPLWGVIVCFLKNLIHLINTHTAGVGELSNFVLGAAFTGVAGLFYKKMKTKKGAFIGSLIGALAMAIFSVITNYYIVYPIYTNFMPMEAIIGAYQAILPSMDSLLKCLIVFNMPFTFVKGMLSVLITFLIYKRISPIIKGDQKL